MFALVSLPVDDILHNVLRGKIYSCFLALCKLGLGGLMVFATGRNNQSNFFSKEPNCLVEGQTLYSLGLDSTVCRLGVKGLSLNRYHSGFWLFSPCLSYHKLLDSLHILL